MEFHCDSQVTEDRVFHNALLLFPKDLFCCSVTLGEEYYRQQYEILDWLRQQGPGDTGIGDPPQGECVWAYTQLFGYQYIAFPTRELVTHFQLVWQNNTGHSG
jgi:hypothetical protein